MKEHQLAPAEIIRRVIEEEKRDKKFQFGQQLRGVFADMIGASSFVKEPRDALFKRIEQVLSVKEQ